MNFNLEGFSIPRKKKQKNYNYTPYVIIISICLIVIFIVYKLISITKEISYYQNERQNIRDILNNKIEDMNVIKDNIYALQNENKQYQKDNEEMQKKIDEFNSNAVALKDNINAEYSIIEELTLSSGMAVMKYKKLQEEANILLQKKEALHQSFGLLIVARNNLRLQYRRYSDELLEKQWKN